jgi:hypothetical protein
MSDGASQTDIETAKAIGAMGANIVTLLDRQERMEKKLDGVVAMTNRWKGATTILIILGGVIGWGTNFLLKLSGRA